MERMVWLPYALPQGCGSTLPLSGPSLWRVCKQEWKQSMGPPVFLARLGPIVPVNLSESCMYPYKRAQLQAILNQMNPSLSLQLCKANTKDVGVQVSLRVDKSVQCSLGPQTLHSSSFCNKTSLRNPTDAYKRALIQLPKDGEDRERQKLTRPAEASQLLPPTWKPESDKQEKLPQLEEILEKDAKSKLSLEPKYGYFHCKDCKTRWESAYVWCISGTNKVYFKQLCCKCQKKCNPYRVEAIQCQICSKSYCSCPQKKRHVDIRRPHRQELCSRCKDKKFSCSNIYSFKYFL